MVTSGSAGLGLAIAAALAQAGSAIVLASRSAGRCAAAAARLSARTGAVVRGQACDVTDEAAVAGLIDRVLAEHGRLDVLVTSAGIHSASPVAGSTPERACLVTLADPASGSPVSPPPAGRLLCSRAAYPGRRKAGQAMTAEPGSVTFQATVAVTGDNTGIVVPEKAIEQFAAENATRAGHRQRVGVPEHGLRGQAHQ